MISFANRLHPLFINLSAFQSSQQPPHVSRRWKEYTSNSIFLVCKLDFKISLFDNKKQKNTLLAIYVFGTILDNYGVP